MNRARRGDLLVVKRITSAAFAMSAGGGIHVSATWTIGKVTKVDRDGYATEFEYDTSYLFTATAPGPVMQRQTLRGRAGEGWGKSLDGLGTLVQSQVGIDVDAAIRGVAPFEDLDAVKAHVRKFIGPKIGA